MYLDEDNRLLAVYDSNNGENDAADVRFEYDEDFEKEDTLDFSVSTAGTFDIEMVLKIYSSLVNYDIPRFLKKRKEEHRKLLEEHEKTWKDVNLDELDHDELLKNKEACFELYEKTGFLTFLDSPYMKGANGWNGTPFKVLRRATTDEADLEVMPIWLIQYENGEKAFCYPRKSASSTRNSDRRPPDPNHQTYDNTRIRCPQPSVRAESKPCLQPERTICVTEHFPPLRASRVSPQGWEMQ